MVTKSIGFPTLPVDSKGHVGTPVLNVRISQTATNFPTQPMRHRPPREKNHTRIPMNHGILFVEGEETPPFSSGNDFKNSHATKGC